MSTTIEPIELFNLIKNVPTLMESFRKECYETPLQESLDHAPEKDKKYSHKLALAFLKRHGIPTTREELIEDSNYNYTAVMTGDVRYNVGQMIVLFSETIYSSGDISRGNTWVLEVMDEFEFPGVPLQSKSVESIRVALKEHLDKGVVRLHPAGIRMYNCTHSYTFADRINKKGNDV